MPIAPLGIMMEENPYLIPDATHAPHTSTRDWEFQWLQIKFPCTLQTLFVCIFAVVMMTFGFWLLLKQLREELTRAMVETTKTDDESEIGDAEDSTLLPSAFNDLVQDVTSKRQDIKAFAFKTKAMVIINPTSISTTSTHTIFSFILVFWFWFCYLRQIVF